uniref:SWIM-type domain-containing protein n=1 Tax=Caenorhabditis tropicalis TaxID=1561998 RepID=A0A1I7TJ57_9PELO
MMSTRLITLFLLICLTTQICCKFVAMIDKIEVDPEEVVDIEEDRKTCFCCRAFVCRHQLCPCSRFTALF